MYKELFYDDIFIFKKYLEMNLSCFTHGWKLNIIAVEKALEKTVLELLTATITIMSNVNDNVYCSLFYMKRHQQKEALLEDEYPAWKHKTLDFHTIYRAISCYRAAFVRKIVAKIGANMWSP